MRRHRIAELAAAALLALPGSALATEGALYPYGASVWAVGAPFSASVLDGPTWLLQAPATTLPAGNVWEMNWGCPVPGSEVAAVRFSALRTQAPSSLEVMVTGNRARLWAEPDSAMPQSPSGGRAYDIGLPGGHCNVHLVLAQAEARAQHARGYFIGNPHVIVRDLTPPGLAIRALSQGWLGAGARLRADWSVDDNFGSDGIGQQRVVVGGQVRWSGHPGAGNHGVDVALDGVPDGVQPVQIVAEGDGTPAAVVAGIVHVDRTPPGATDLQAAPAGPGAVTLAWRAEDNLSGVVAAQAQLNTAPDGGAGGAWMDAGAPSGGGAHSITVAPPVADGLHAWRVRVTDAAGNTAHVPGPSPVVVDAHGPAVQLHGLPAGWISRLELDLTATDALQSVLGIGATEVDVNTATDGGESGAWSRRATADGVPGRRVIPVPLQGLASGRHALRVTVRNGGPFPALATEVRGTLKVDVDPPAIARAVFAGDAGRRVTAAWTADDVHAGVASATLQWRQAGAWRPLGSTAAGDGSGTLTVDASALPAGQQAVRLVVTDGAGNVAKRTGTVEVSGGGVGSIASDPLARLRGARLTVAVNGARARRERGGVVLVRRVMTGGAVTIHGTLLDRSRRPIVGAEVQARGHRGRVIGRAVTRRGGRFAFIARPDAGGVVRIGVAAGGQLLPRRANASLRLEVRPRVELAASFDTVPAGGTVLFSGRLTPSPGRLGFGARKLVVLEWLDPVRRAWRPVVNGRLRADGTFAIPWTFNLRGFTIPVRVTVPHDVGWPLLQGRSRAVRVRVTE